MNCNVYFFLNASKGFSQYPDNYTQDIIKDALSHSSIKTNISQFAISLSGKLVYLTYQYRYSDTKYFGICCEYNNIMPTNFEYLFEFFDNIVKDILNKGELLYYDSSGEINSRVDNLSENVALLDFYSGYIRTILDSKKAAFVTSPSQNYTTQKKSVGVLSLGDASTQLVNLLQVYDNVIVSRENPYICGYVNTLKKSQDRIFQLETNLSKLNKQKKQYRVVALLGFAILVCLGIVLSFNSDIKSLTGDLNTRKKEVKTLTDGLNEANVRIDDLCAEIAEKNHNITLLQREVNGKTHKIDSLIEEANIKDSMIYELENEVSSVSNKLANIESRVSKKMPIIINDIEIAGGDSPSSYDYGKTIYSSTASTLWFRIKYYGLVSGYKMLKFKIYNHYGTQIASSYDGYFYSYNYYLFTGEDTKDLFKTTAIRSSGKYRIEVWYEDVCLKSKSFEIK